MKEIDQALLKKVIIERPRSFWGQYTFWALYCILRLTGTTSIFTLLLYSNIVSNQSKTTLWTSLKLLTWQWASAPLSASNI